MQPQKAYPRYPLIPISRRCFKLLEFLILICTLWSICDIVYILHSFPLDSNSINEEKKRLSDFALNCDKPRIGFALLLGWKIRKFIIPCVVLTLTPIFFCVLLLFWVIGGSLASIEIIKAVFFMLILLSCSVGFAYALSLPARKIFTSEFRRKLIFAISIK